MAKLRSTMPQFILAVCLCSAAAKINNQEAPAGLVRKHQRFGHDIFADVDSQGDVHLHLHDLHTRGLTPDEKALAHDDEKLPAAFTSDGSVSETTQSSQIRSDSPTGLVHKFQGIGKKLVGDVDFHGDVHLHLHDLDARGLSPNQKWLVLAEEKRKVAVASNGSVSEIDHPNCAYKKIANQVCQPLISAVYEWDYRPSLAACQYRCNVLRSSCAAITYYGAGEHMGSCRIIATQCSLMPDRSLSGGNAYMKHCHSSALRIHAQVMLPHIACSSATILKHDGGNINVQQCAEMAWAGKGGDCDDDDKAIYIMHSHSYQEKPYCACVRNGHTCFSHTYVVWEILMLKVEAS